MSEIFFNDGGTPRSLGHTADPQLPGKVSELESRVEALEAKPDYALPVATTDTVGGVKVDGTTITARPDGTISAVGDGSGPELSDAVDSDSRTTVASSLAVKTAYDAATAAGEAADAASAAAGAAQEAATAAQETADAAAAVAEEAKAAAEAAQEKAEQALSGITVPAGGIIAFSGSFGGDNNRNPIPLGSLEPDTSWFLCDGGSDGKGGTVPDLRGRMIMGASDTYAAGSTGGTETHTHGLSGTVGETTLSVEQMPVHGHESLFSQVGGISEGTGGAVKRAGINQNWPTQWSGGGQSHTHSLSGESGQTSALPPYYALAYIMRVA